MPDSVLRTNGRHHQSQPVCRLNGQELGREEMQREAAHSLILQGKSVQHGTGECSRMGWTFKEIHFEIFLPALPCTWQVPGRIWPLGSDILKASWGKSGVRSLFNCAKRLHWRQRGHILRKGMRLMGAEAVS